MAFVLKQSDSYSWRVEFVVPGDNKHETQSFDAQFRRMTTSEITEVQVSLSALQDMDASDAMKAGVSVCRKLLTGWAGIDDGTGDALPFSDGNLSKLLEVPGVMPAIVRAWSESLKDAPAKN